MMWLDSNIDDPDSMTQSMDRPAAGRKVGEGSGALPCSQAAAYSHWVSASVLARRRTSNGEGEVVDKTFARIVLPQILGGTSKH